MNILVISATDAEQKDLRTKIKKEKTAHNIVWAHSGIGNLMTASNLSVLIAKKKFELVIQIGIAGSFCKRRRKRNDVVVVQSEILGDLYIEEKKKFKDGFELGLIKKNQRPFRDGQLKNPKKFKELKHLEHVIGLTVNTIHDSELINKKRRKKWNPDIESMEGAALHYVCLLQKIPFIQIRAISNFVGVRDKTEWTTEEALIALHDETFTFISKLK